jgi:hypothetical protein
MATITQFRWHEMDLDDKRDITANMIRNKIVLKTSERVTWTNLRTMQPVPRHGDEHPKEPGFYLDYIKPTHKSRHVWELETEYTPFKAGQIDPDPLARGVVITYTSSLVEQASLVDNKGRPTVNRAGEFIQGIVKQVPILEYTFVKNLAQDPRWIQTHLGAVNSDAIKLRGLLWEPKTLLLSAVQGGEITTENRSTFAPITGTIMADPRGWTQEVWNLGTVQLREETVKVPRKDLPGTELKKVWRQIPITKGNPAEPVTEAVPIDEYGRWIPDSLDKSTTEPMKKGRLITLRFDMQDERPFTELPLK